MVQYTLETLQSMPAEDFVKLRMTQVEKTCALRLKNRTIHNLLDPNTKGGVMYAIRQIGKMYYYLGRNKTYILKSLVKDDEWDHMLEVQAQALENED